MVETAIREIRAVVRVIRPFQLLLLGCLGLPACRPKQATLFEQLDSSRTGVTFVNALSDSDTTFNIINYLYYYDGGGVAVGDVNNDGLPDLYFTANRGANRLYLNRGNFHFEDVTARAAVADTVGWKTGATMADVNGDGWLDIFVCGVDYLGVHGRNVLYINNHDGTFTDRTAEYGLEFAGYSTQALFFDYDGDGDLDMYLLNHSVHQESGLSTQPQRFPRHPKAGDRLYRNDGGHFTDVSEQAHIYGGVEGYGLGVVATDVNLDGCPDLYVANDFQENDFLYINDCHGGFTESIARWAGHTSHASMGVDAADVDNDGRPDVVVADMLPERQAILNTSANAERFEVERMKLAAGYLTQYARNTLQWNRGADRFSEIGLMAGIYATDWSWAPLLADFDDDGHKDLFITNGIWRRPNDLDYLKYIESPSIQTSLARGVTRENIGLVKLMPHVPQPNHAFRNRGDLTFANASAAWGLAQPGFSNGAAYADLDNDGRLDLVVNNLGAPAAVYRNRGAPGTAFLEVTLAGDAPNTEGIGARVRLVSRGMQQVLEEQPTRGFQSSVDPRLHFGLGALAGAIDSLIVIWPDRRYQVLTGVAPNQRITLKQTNATGRYAFAHDTTRLFSDVTDSIRLPFTHRENEILDFEREPLIPHVLSREGPALAVADVNGDGLDDVFIGGAKWQPSALFLQQADGTFRESRQPAMRADSLSEDVDAAFFDANGDGKPDLYVVSGGNEFWGTAPQIQDRLYLNDGHGNLVRDATALPTMSESGSCVVVADFNGDGKPDLFVGRRSVTWRYGDAPRSLLLENDGRGHFRDVTDSIAPGLARVGMVTSAAWVDYDGDGKLDLIVAGEWMAVHAFHNAGGRFVDRSGDAGFAGTDGWWSSVTVADVNGDGRADLVLGNLGLNSYLKASAEHPARLYVGDFAHNDSLQQVITTYRDGADYPIPGRDELSRAMPEIARKYASYAAFGASKLQDIFPRADVRKAHVLEARTFASSVAINDGAGHFTLRALPSAAQLSPVFASLSRDWDGDGTPDLLLVGNRSGVEPIEGRYDASYGQIFRVVGRGSSVRFVPVDLETAGVPIDGQVRHIRPLHSARFGDVLLMARNGTTLQILRPKRQSGSPGSHSPPNNRP